MSIALEVKDIVKKYGSQTILDRLSLNMREGEVLGLLGPNGAGKSTLMNIMCGMIESDGGTATFYGKKYVDIEDPGRKIGVMLDPTWLDSRITAESVLKIQALRLKLDKPNQVVDKVLERVDLSHARGKKVSGLSLGMKQRLALGVALIGSPKMLILDEPVNGLDADGIVWVRDILHTFAKNGGSVLLSSHLMSEVEQTATRVAILNGGKIVVEDEIKNLSTDENTTEFAVSGDASRLLNMLNANRINVSHDQKEDRYTASGVKPDLLFSYAVQSQTVLTYLTLKRSSLENVYFDWLDKTGHRARA
ncbi:MAG: ATP-binding cassette domain-containing protein [Bifidobacteriaceae bacterium]|nr:ATP-binding cassette domain-containing protein [Bifidobacteriaceae bacterium]MEE0940454.1 ATP-binding cassette domain-containing protein [Bifidobacteriaceae bacterium]